MGKVTHTYLLLMGGEASERADEWAAPAARVLAWSAGEASREVPSMRGRGGGSVVSGIEHHFQTLDGPHFSRERAPRSAAWAPTRQPPLSRRRARGHDAETTQPPIPFCAGVRDQQSRPPAAACGWP